MSDSLVQALTRKASMRADELLARANNYDRIAKLLEEEGFETAAEDVERLGAIYRKLSEELRTVLKAMTETPVRKPA